MCWSCDFSVTLVVPQLLAQGQYYVQNNSQATSHPKILSVIFS